MNVPTLDVVIEEVAIGNVNGIQCVFKWTGWRSLTSGRERERSGQLIGTTYRDNVSGQP